MTSHTGDNQMIMRRQKWSRLHSLFVHCRNAGEYFVKYSLYALDLHLPNLFKEGMLRPACLWNEAPPMRRL